MGVKEVVSARSAPAHSCLAGWFDNVTDSHLCNGRADMTAFYHPRPRFSWDRLFVPDYFKGPRIGIGYE